MANLADRLRTGYEKAHERDPNLTHGQYMQEVYGHYGHVNRGGHRERVWVPKYNSPESGARAWRKVQRGETSTTRLEEEAIPEVHRPGRKWYPEEPQPETPQEEFRPRYRHLQPKGRAYAGRGVNKTRERRYGGGRQGLWIMVVHYEYQDSETGEWNEDAVSTILESVEYTSMTDYPYIKRIAGELADALIERWIAKGSMPPNYRLREIDVTPIRRYNQGTAEPINIDAFEENPEDWSEDYLSELEDEEY